MDVHSLSQADSIRMVSISVEMNHLMPDSLGINVFPTVPSLGKGGTCKSQLFPG